MKSNLLQYAAHNYAFTAINLSVVSKKFGVASKSNQIWKRIYYKNYPEQNPNLKLKDWHKFFKARFSAIQKHRDAHPIGKIMPHVISAYCAMTVVNVYPVRGL